jgi:hypothetical protein
LRVVQRWLGHSSIVTSERYSHGAGDGFISLLSFRGETDPQKRRARQASTKVVPSWCQPRHPKT